MSTQSSILEVASCSRSGNCLIRKYIQFSSNLLNIHLEGRVGEPVSAFKMLTVFGGTKALPGGLHPEWTF